MFIKSCPVTPDAADLSDVSADADLFLSRNRDDPSIRTKRIQAVAGFTEGLGNENLPLPPHETCQPRQCQTCGRRDGEVPGRVRTPNGRPFGRFALEKTISNGEQLTLTPQTPLFLEKRLVQKVEISRVPLLCFFASPPKPTIFPILVLLATTTGANRRACRRSWTMSPTRWL